MIVLSRLHRHHHVFFSQKTRYWMHVCVCVCVLERIFACMFVFVCLYVHVSCKTWIYPYEVASDYLANLQRIALQHIVKPRNNKGLLLPSRSISIAKRWSFYDPSNIHTHIHITQLSNAHKTKSCRAQLWHCRWLRSPPLWRWLCWRLHSPPITGWATRWNGIIFRWDIKTTIHYCIQYWVDAKNGTDWATKETMYAYATFNRFY